MRNDLLLEPWKICWHGKGIQDDFLESVFFTGNGRMGARGYLPLDRGQYPVQTGIYIAGIFGAIKPGITDFVNLPSPIMDEIYIDGVRAGVKGTLEQELDLHNAVLTARMTVCAGEKQAVVCHQRFFSKEQTGCCLQRVEIIPQQTMSLEIRSGLYLASCNCPVPDDQTKKSAETIQLAVPSEIKKTEDGMNCIFQIAGTNLTIEQRISFHGCDVPDLMFHDELGISECFKKWLDAGEPFSLDKLAYITTNRDKDPRIKKPTEMWTYSAFLKEQNEAWSHVWQKCDIPCFPNDPEMQCAIRYSILQLISSCSSKDPTVSIGARGLTHGRYKGCYFWDTDLFMLPFFLENDMEAARNLCEYRARSLSAAKLHSQEMNTSGARYPWMASLDGSEQCESWDIGCSELHVTADVVYALDQYCRKCNDNAFYLDYAAEVYVETARFWISRYTFYDEGETADLLFCKGPDEYCGISSNNLFTNVMVQHNLSLAVQAAKDLRNNRSEIYQSLGLSDPEITRWQSLQSMIRWPRDPNTGNLTEDDTFYRLEPVEKSRIKQGDEASYHKVCFDRLQRYRVVKQADVILIMTRFPELFTSEEKIQAWNDFEPICLHDSTLSFASHALFAIQNNLKEHEDRYLRKALLLDLRDIMGNTGKEGLHLACMGEAWQAVFTRMQHNE